MTAHGNQSLPSDPKILVIGAGPAGSATAIWCAKHGLPVTIIESSKFPRDRPGEAVHPGIECIFSQLGVREEIESAGFLRYPGTMVEWNSKPVFIPFGIDQSGPWLGYQVRRSDLDTILLERARSLGVVVLQPCQALGVIIKAKKVVGIKTSSGEYRADFTIDAGGSGHWLARKLNISIEACSPPLYIHYGYVEGKCPARDLVPAMTAISGGWLWTAKVREDLYQWMRLTFRKTSITYDWLPSTFQGLRPRQFARGADVSWRHVVLPSGLGYLTVGDAFGVVDPSSFHGILRGLMSGIMAAHTILQITNNHLQDQLAISQYNEWLCQWFLHDVTTLKALYMHHPDHPTWT